MKITLEWLREQRACDGGVAWFKSQKKSEAVQVLNALITLNHLDWANWLIVRVMTRPQYLGYAIFSAEQVLDIYEQKYPGDDRPRKAIESARAVLANDTAENRAAAEAAAWAAGAAWAAEAARAAAWAAEAARAAAWAAWAAEAARAAARAAAWAAAWAAWAEMQLRILNYGLGLLKGKGGV